MLQVEDFCRFQDYFLFFLDKTLLLLYIYSELTKEKRLKRSLFNRFIEIVRIRIIIMLKIAKIAIKLKVLKFCNFFRNFLVKKKKKWWIYHKNIIFLSGSGLTCKNFIAIDYLLFEISSKPIEKVTFQEKYIQNRYLQY